MSEGLEERARTRWRKPTIAAFLVVIALILVSVLPLPIELGFSTWALKLGWQCVLCLALPVTVGAVALTIQGKFLRRAGIGLALFVGFNTFFLVADDALFNPSWEMRSDLAREEYNEVDSGGWKLRLYMTRRGPGRHPGLEVRRELETHWGLVIVVPVWSHGFAAVGDRLQPRPNGEVDVIQGGDAIAHLAPTDSAIFLAARNVRSPAIDRITSLPEIFHPDPRPPLRLRKRSVLDEAMES